MHMKISIGSIVLALATSTAAAQLPGIDAPTGAGAASGPPPGASGDARDNRGAGAPQNGAANQADSGTLKNAIELCERLAGVEREVCLVQAQENRERALPGIGATPGNGGMGAGGAERGGAATR